MGEYIRDPEWVSVNRPGNPLVALRMFGKVVAARSQTTPAWLNDQPGYAPDLPAVALQFNGSRWTLDTANTSPADGFLVGPDVNGRFAVDTGATESSLTLSIVSSHAVVTY